MDPILIICNGPSTAQIDWTWLKSQKLDTFGMNNGYKLYESLDFYPTYYACLDNVTIRDRAAAIQELIRKNRIQRLFLHSAYEFDPHPSYQKVVKTPQRFGDFFDTADSHSTFDQFESWMNTGSDAVQISIMMGYRTIYVIGADGYLPMGDLGTNLAGNHYQVKETPDYNPNYWFANYLEKGEEFNHPFGANKQNEAVTVPGWRKTNLVCKRLGIRIWSLSNTGPLPKLAFSDFLRSRRRIFT